MLHGFVRRCVIMNTTNTKISITEIAKLGEPAPTFESLDARDCLVGSILLNAEKTSQKERAMYCPLVMHAPLLGACIIR